MRLCQHPDDCLNWTEGNTDYCSTHNRQLRKEHTDKLKEQQKRERLLQQQALKEKKAREKQKEDPVYIAPRSKGRAKEEREYSKLVKEWKLLPENQICKVCNSAPTEDCHHQKGRIGPLLLDQRYWLPVCRSCHNYIQVDSAFSIREGYSLPRNT